jgi:head-tail adaptor
MRGGRLDRRVVVQRKTLSYLDSGEPVETWSTLATRFAQISGLLSGEESSASAQLSSKERIEFRFRWEQMLSGLSSLDRIIYPEADASESPIPTRSIYDVTAVGEIGRREALQVQTFRRSDATP